MIRLLSVVLDRFVGVDVARANARQAAARLTRHRADVEDTDAYLAERFAEPRRSSR